MLISNIDRIGAGVNQALLMTTSAITLGVLAAAAFALSPQVAAAIGAGGALVLIAYRGMRRRAGLLGQALGQAYEQVHAAVSEASGALRVIKSFGREERAEAELMDGFVGLRAVQQAYVRDTGLARIALQGGGAALLAVVAAVAMEHYRLGAAAIVPVVVLFARAMPLLGAIQEAWQNWRHAAPAVDAAGRLIAELEAAQEPRGDISTPPPALHRELALENVTVRHAGRDRPALDSVSLILPARSTTIVTGPSGAGKSTLADMLGGLLAPDSGALRIDGKPLESARQQAWRSRVAYVQQEPVLFHATIRANLLWARPEANEAQLQAALNAASAGFVLALPEGLDTVVGDRGTRLSGGERQRIALARGLLREPQLLILDEVTSALDAENEAAVAAAVANLRGRLTIVIIGHRGALADLADRRVRLEHGQVMSC